MAPENETRKGSGSGHCCQSKFMEMVKQFHVWTIKGAIKSLGRILKAILFLVGFLDTDHCSLMSRHSTCKRPTLTPHRWTLNCSVVWAFSSTSVESTTRRWIASVRLSPSRHRSDKKEALMSDGANFELRLHVRPNLALLLTFCRTTCCGISWVLRLLMEVAQKKRWQLTGEP